MIDANDMKPGITFKDKGSIFIVLSASHSHQGRGQATVKIKIKDLITGSITMKTISGGGKFEKAHIDKTNVIFSYDDGDNYIFMDEETFEQVPINKSKLEWEINFIVDGSKVILISHEGKNIGIQLKPQATLMVTDTEPAVAGNTASGKAMKRAMTEKGLEIQVPLFIKNNDYVIVSTEDGSYISRQKKG